MASKELTSMLCGCIVLLIGIIDDSQFLAMARSTTTTTTTTITEADKSITLLQQHLCRDECSTKVCFFRFDRKQWKTSFFEVLKWLKQCSIFYSKYKNRQTVFFKKKSHFFIHLVLYFTCIDFSLCSFSLGPSSRSHF